MKVSRPSTFMGWLRSKIIGPRFAVLVETHRGTAVSFVLDEEDADHVAQHLMSQPGFNHEATIHRCTRSGIVCHDAARTVRRGA